MHGDKKVLLPDDWQITGDGAEFALWHGVASSQLGKPVERRGRWFRMLERVVQQALHDAAAIAVVEGTASSPWVQRAACLYRCPLVLITPQARGKTCQFVERDEVIFNVADRLTVLRARRGGRVTQIALKHLRRLTATERMSVTAAVWPDSDDAGATLVSEGAIGWFLYSDPDSQALSDDPCESVACNRFFSERVPEGEWLFHCTRARSGPLPGQTTVQWRDEVLLQGAGGQDMSPFEVLAAILRDKCVRAASIRSDHHKVVCLADMPLPGLLARRTFRSHRGRWDYEPFGLGIKKEAVISLGGLPVVYAENLAAANLTTQHAWRYQSTGQTYDWTTECEWRVPNSIDLAKLNKSDYFAFAGDSDSANELAQSFGCQVVIAPVNLTSRTGYNSSGGDPF